MDKYKALFTGPAIDVASEIGRLLPDGDRALVHSQVVPSGVKRGGGGVGVDGRLMNLVTSAVETAVSRSQHIGGEEGSTARTLPNEGGVPVARLTFADGSFADQRLISKPGPEFWSVAAAI
ncbi:hypothetical protein [Curtobacterium sp. BH-2-1-1]|uniref:hypothetical protein n=1 Tax=Curtobacterium sp. BH-2-1-1 TaxID=1905847 RepID=UPI00119FB60E|nr:hypothetical protein [Curtobacterium sp. BH-2-1-1]